jgi:hypothetical protein
MKRKAIIFIFLFSFLFLIPFPSSAFYSNDKINDNFSYESLKISGKYLTGYIINTSKNSIKNISFRVYGRKSGTSEFMWEVFMVLGNLNAGEKTPFREYILDESKGTSIIIFKEHSSYIVRPEPVKTTERIKEHTTTIKTLPSKPYKPAPSLPKKPLKITEDADGTITITQ